MDRILRQQDATRAGRTFARLAPFLALLLLTAACGGSGAAGVGDAGGAAPPTAPPPEPPTGTTQPFPLFRTVAIEAGVVTPHVGIVGYVITGQAFGDYDGDGDLDLYLTTNDGANTLYENRGDGTFGVSPLSSVVAVPDLPSGGAVFVDYDNDGWKDLYVLNWGPNRMFRNLAGTGFADVTAETGLGDPGKGSTAGFGDYDGDGHLDVYVANWLCLDCGGKTDVVKASADRLYHSRGDGTFEDVSDLIPVELRGGLGYIGGWVDYDDDGDLDVYVVNDKGSAGDPVPGSPMNRNLLYRNDGPGPSGWRFTEVGIQAGADTRCFGMGLAVGDPDHDGDFDLYFSDEGLQHLLVNQGDGTFREGATAAGCDAGPFTIGWGPVFCDFDLDGHEDIALAISDPGRLLPVWLGRGDGTFEDVTDVAGLADRGLTLGMAWGDYDRDGWPDIVTGDRNGVYHLWRNLGAGSGRGHHWLALRLEGAGPVNRDAVGARAWVTRSDGLVMLRQVMCGTGHGGGSDLALHFGLGHETVTDVRVRWPDGTEEHLGALAVDREVRVTYGGPR
jgi:hypothetical protein